jgi:microcystin degradation protein MlrC
VIEAKLTAPTLFASFVSPEIVVAAQTAGLGSTIAVTLGARNGTHFGHGIDVEATVERLTDGVFLNSGPMQTGVERRCGPSVVLRIHHLPSLHVIVTERVVAADDPAFYALHGVEFDQLRLLCVKAKNHFRAAFATRCIEIIDCDSPGPACLDLSQLPFKNRHIPLSHTRE